MEAGVLPNDYDTGFAINVSYCHHKNVLENNNARQITES
jgi:hypothetical protein